MPIERLTKCRNRIQRYAKETGFSIQHAAAISKGSSGGPLVDRAGRVIAMHTLYVSAVQNLNFGVSSGDLQLLLNRRSSLLKVSAESVPDLNPNPSER